MHVHSSCLTTQAWLKLVNAACMHRSAPCSRPLSMPIHTAFRCSDPCNLAWRLASKPNNGSMRLEAVALAFSKDILRYISHCHQSSIYLVAYKDMWLHAMAFVDEHLCNLAITRSEGTGGTLPTTPSQHDREDSEFKQVEIFARCFGIITYLLTSCLSALSN